VAANARHLLADVFAARNTTTRRAATTPSGTSLAFPAVGWNHPAV